VIGNSECSCSMLQSIRVRGHERGIRSSPMSYLIFANPVKKPNKSDTKEMCRLDC
jgi:hypothetical protein